MNGDPPAPGSAAAQADSEHPPVLLCPPPNRLAALIAHQLADGSATDTTTAGLVTSYLLRAALYGNVDTIEWLLSPADQDRSDDGFREEPASRDARAAACSLVDRDARDLGGLSALALCVAWGHFDATRSLLEGGCAIDAQDDAGWSPLHWAVAMEDVAIASYLLNHHADILTRSRSGQTPSHLVRRGPGGAAMRHVLLAAHEARQAAGSSPSQLLSPEERQRQMAIQEVTRLAQQASALLEIDYRVTGALVDEYYVGPKLERHASGDEDPLRRSMEPEMQRLFSALSPCADFSWDDCLPTQMLVFAMADLLTILETTITRRLPTTVRADRLAPASLVFLCARFADLHGTEEMLSELLLGAVESIENVVHEHMDDMSFSAFWLSNSLALLYYLRRDSRLRASTAEFQEHISDLINEIVVFVIRDAERRLDRVLDASMLDHEPLPGFEDVVFEREWSLKTLTNRVSSTPPSTSKRQSLRKPSSGSVFSLFNTAQHDGGSMPQATPQTATALLSSTLFIMQAFELPPFVIAQAFSQILYWFSCELFNRILTRRKFLCRSKAMQIRLNVSIVEDWLQQSRLPPKLATVHFAALHQLLQWLQCLSSEVSIDGLIGTVQTLRSLNPSQLARAAKDYRHEVDEPHMDADCFQYLLEMQKQWTNARGQPPAPRDTHAGEASRAVDQAFAHSSSYGTYAPSRTPDASGELLDSRHMLPFAVPVSDAPLVNLDALHAFGCMPAPPTFKPQGASANVGQGLPWVPYSLIDELDEARAERDAPRDAQHTGAAGWTPASPLKRELDSLEDTTDN